MSTAIVKRNRTSRNRVSKTRWSVAELEIISVNYKNLGPRGCAPLLPMRTIDTICSKAIRMGLTEKEALTDLQRFESKFRVTPGCWVWIAAMDRRGYGAFTVAGKYVRAHRYSFEQYNGPLTSDLCVCHSCDNPMCVNPSHLFLGTHLDNAIDRESKGRGARMPGTEQPMSKLNDDAVRLIRASLDSQREIADRYGVCQAVISRIRHRKSWAHVADVAASCVGA